MIIDRIVMKAGVLSGRLVYRGFEHFTSNAAETQKKLLQNLMNTRDYTMYSPAELLMRVGNAYKGAQRDYTQMIREYSYNHGDLTGLHL